MLPSLPAITDNLITNLINLLFLAVSVFTVAFILRLVLLQDVIRALHRIAKALERDK